MLEMGHPMHAFDAARLAGAEIRVRAARPGERITDARRRDRARSTRRCWSSPTATMPVAIAGVMGGAASEVSDGTTPHRARKRLVRAGVGARDQPQARPQDRGVGAIRARRRRQRAGHRASTRALQLLQEIGAGTAGRRRRRCLSRSSTPTTRPAAELAHLATCWARPCPTSDVRADPDGAGIPAGVDQATGFWSTCPSFRVDVAREADLIEEVGTPLGVRSRFPRRFHRFARRRHTPAPDAEIETRLRDLARGAGVQEAVTFTFIERAPWPSRSSRPARPLVAIANPLSEKFAVLRPSLLPGLVDSLVYNRRRESDVRPPLRAGLGLPPRRRDDAHRLGADRRARSESLERFGRTRRFLRRERSGRAPGAGGRLSSRTS